MCGLHSVGRLKLVRLCSLFARCLGFVTVRKRNISMDLESPRSLEELCINSLAKRPDILWSWKDGSQLPEPIAVEWRDSEVVLHSQLADRLLEILSSKGRLSDGMLSTFTQDHVCLKNVKISDWSHITEDGLQVLSHHKLISLDIRCPLHIICTVLQCIGNKSYESLQHLILRRIKPMWECELWPCDDDLCGQFIIETLSKFRSLKRVDVSETNVQNTMLSILGKSLLHVENLNLSGNSEITDISPLKNCHKTLRSLSLEGLDDITVESAMATFVTLTGLTYLDVSSVTGRDFDSYEEYKYSRLPRRHWRKAFTADMLLQMLDVLPNLVCLDLSGRTVRSKRALSQFLDAHQSLQMLMLWESAACQFESLQSFRPRLTVGGDATLEQYSAVLRHWTRIDEHQGISVELSRRRLVVRKLNSDLKKKNFPPCGDGYLAQVMLGLIPICTCRLIDCISLCVMGIHCLEIICRLMEKRIIRHLEPDTKQPLLRFCDVALNRHPADPDVSKEDIFQCLTSWHKVLKDKMKTCVFTEQQKVTEVVGRWVRETRLQGRVLPPVVGPEDSNSRLSQLMEEIGGPVCRLAPEQLLLVARAGSFMYGLSTPESDVDYVVIFQEKTEVVLGACNKVSECFESRGPTKTVEYGAYEARMLCEMLMKCSVVMLELGYLGEHEYVSPLWQQLHQHREKFVTELAIQQYLGLIKNNFGMINSQRCTRRERKLFYQVFHKMDSVRSMMTGVAPPVRVTGPVRDFIMDVRTKPLEGGLSRENILKKATTEFEDLRQQLGNSWPIDTPGSPNGQTPIFSLTGFCP